MSAHVHFYEIRSDGIAVVFDSPVPRYANTVREYRANKLAELKKQHPGYHLQPVWERSV